MLRELSKSGLGAAEFLLSFVQCWSLEAPNKVQAP